MHADVIKAWQAAGRTFESLGATVEAVRLPDWYFDLSRPAGTIIASEAYALHRDYIEDSDKAIGPGVRARAQAAKQLGAGCLSRGDADARAAAALLHRVVLRLRRAPAADHGDPRDPCGRGRRDLADPGYLTRPANYLGLCGLAMPAGQSGGLPVGVQIVGKPFAERDVLRLGKAFQDATDFHRRAPDLSALGLYFGYFHSGIWREVGGKVAHGGGPRP